MDNTIQVVAISVLRFLPEFLAWGIGLFLAVLMLRRGGGKAEKLLLIGCSFILMTAIINIGLNSAEYWIQDQEISAQQYGLIMSISAIPGFAGFICLLLAFWFRFYRKRTETA